MELAAHASYRELAALTSNAEKAGISAPFSVSSRKRIKRAMERLREAEKDLP
jgi:hypothetical protein